MLKRLAVAGAVLLTAGTLQAASLVETFESLANAGPVIPVGWTQTNLSNPIAAFGWFPQTNFTAPPGAHTGLNAEAVNFQSGSGLATLSNWLILPQDTWNDGDTIDFWTRSLNTTATSFPDRLQVRFSGSGASVNVGASATSVGDFTTLFLDINPTYTLHGYPEAWALQHIVVSGLGGPTSGRMAFRYFVENGGPSGANSNAILIDDLTIASGVVPEPTSIGMIGLALVGVTARRRRA